MYIQLTIFKFCITSVEPSDLLNKFYNWPTLADNKLLVSKVNLCSVAFPCIINKCK